MTNSSKSATREGAKWGIGGGLAGLSLAIQLALKNLPINITVVERQSHPVNEAAHKVGESLVELSSYYFGEMLDLKSNLT